LPELTEEQLKKFIEDEDKAVKIYQRVSFKKLARGERQHKRFLQKKLKEIKREKYLK